MYIVTKDGLYLMNYHDFGIREVDSSGVFKSVLTGYYTDRREDAMVVETKAISEALGAKAVAVKTKKGGRSK